MNKETQAVYSRLISAGLSLDDAVALRRCALTLRRWFERECGDANGWYLERDEATGKTYNVNSNTDRRYRTPDRETGARKRAASIIANYPGLTLYVQTDPRGAAVYVLRPGDVPTGEDVYAFYNHGIAVY